MPGIAEPDKEENKPKKMVIVLQDVSGTAENRH
jgi:hypothetical protein